MSLTDKEKERLVKLIGMLGSAFDGEKANAASMLQNMAEAKKLTINELMAMAFQPSGPATGQKPPPPPPPPEDDFEDIDQANDLLCRLRDIAAKPAVAARVLTNWEINFATDVGSRYSADYDLSEKQLAIVQKILIKASRVFKW